MAPAGLRLIGLRADAVCFGADIVDATIDFALTEDGLDLVGQGDVLAQVDGLAAVVLDQVESVLIVVADDDAGCAEKACCCCAAASDRPGAGDVQPLNLVWPLPR